MNIIPGILIYLSLSTIAKDTLNNNLKMPTITDQHKLSYLALGDSYTIGEQVTFNDNFPNQVVRIFKNDSLKIQQPRIIAKTGWTTQELIEGVRKSNIEEALKLPYDFVTLLIGVNNQFRGQSLASYKQEFTILLDQAIHFAGDRSSRVVVLSIPDWGVTAFAKDYDARKIAVEIDAFNEANKEITGAKGAQYIEITSLGREVASDPSFTAPDGLHPSAKEYERWAEKTAGVFEAMIKQ